MITRSASGSAVVVEELIVGAELGVDLAHILFHDGGQRVIVLVARLTMLEEDIAVFMAAAHGGVLGVQRMLAERFDSVHIAHFLQVVIIPDFDLLDLMGGTEAVKEVDERHTALNRGQVRNSAQIHDFLLRSLSHSIAKPV